MMRHRDVLPLLLPLFALAWAGRASASATPTPPVATGSSYVWELLAILLPLAFIILCLLLLLRLLRRRFGLAGPDAPLTVVQVLPVGPRERLVVVRSRAGRAFAIGVSANAVTLVSTLDEDDLAAPAAPASSPEEARPQRASLLQRFKVKPS